MSTRRRLLVQQPNRQRQSSGSTTATTAERQPLTRLTAADDLPPHEPLELPLNDASVRKMAEIANRSANLRVYDTHLKKSADLLREAIGSVNDTLSERTTQLQEIMERRRERGRDEPSKNEEELAKIVARLTESVGELTAQVERGARTTIDLQMELEDERQALLSTASRLETQQTEDRRRRQKQEQADALHGVDRIQQRRARKRRRTEGGDGGDGEDGKDKKDENDDEDDEDDDNEDEEQDIDQGPPPASAVNLLREERAIRAATYAQMTPHQKYGLNNDYITFKQAWHYSAFPESDVALPDASAWFDAAGEPVRYGPNAGGSGNGGAGENDDDDDDNAADDDDLVVQREVISFKCPLSLVTMEDPYRSKVCKHTFERSAIMEYLRSEPQSGPKKCPQTGCDKVLATTDLAPDNVMRRRIQRAEKMEQRRNEAAATSDMEDDAAAAQDVEDVAVDRKPGMSQAESVARSVKRERFQRTR